MTTAFDGDADIVPEHRSRQRKRFGAVGKIDERVERRKRSRGALQNGNRREQVGQQSLEQHAFTGERALLRR